MNVNDYVIADTVFGSPMLSASEQIFINTNRVEALKLRAGHNLTLLLKR